jgi:hypothetical protein
MRSLMDDPSETEEGTLRYWLECEYEVSNDDPLKTEEGTCRTLSVGLSVSMRSLNDNLETKKGTCGKLSVGLSVSLRSLWM